MTRAQVDRVVARVARHLCDARAGQKPCTKTLRLAELGDVPAMYEVAAFELMQANPDMGQHKDDASPMEVGFSVVLAADDDDDDGFDY